MPLRALHRRGFFHLLSANFVTQFLGFGTILLVAKFLRPAELGEVKILQSYTAVLIVVAGLGYNAAVLKRCSEGLSDEENRRVLHHAVHRSLLGSLATLALLGLFAAAGLAPSPRLGRWLLVYAALIPFAVLTNLLVVYLQARQRVRAMALVQTAIKLESFATIVAATWIWGFAGFVGATVLAYLLGALPLLRELRLGWVLRPPRPVPEGLVRLATWSVFANGVNLIGQYIDIFVLDHSTSQQAAIGYYSLATVFVMAAMQVTATVQSIATPLFSERAHDTVWFRRQIVRQQLRTTALSVVVAAAVLVGAHLVLPIVYGTKYAATLTYLPILLLRYVVASSYAILGVGLFGLGLVHYNLVAVAIATPIGAVLSYVMLRHYGIVGLAWAQVGTAACTLAVQMIQTRIGLQRLPLATPQHSPATPG